jgi:hypothetical protein
VLFLDTKGKFILFCFKKFSFDVHEDFYYKMQIYRVQTISMLDQRED